jgi:hypothetical protein
MRREDAESKSVSKNLRLEGYYLSYFTKTLNASSSTKPLSTYFSVYSMEGQQRIMETKASKDQAVQKQPVIPLSCPRPQPPPGGFHQRRRMKLVELGAEANIIVAESARISAECLKLKAEFESPGAEAHRIRAERDRIAMEIDRTAVEVRLIAAKLKRINPETIFVHVSSSQALDRDCECTASPIADRSAPRSANILFDIKRTRISSELERLLMEHNRLRWETQRLKSGLQQLKKDILRLPEDLSQKTQHLGRLVLDEEVVVTKDQNLRAELQSIVNDTLWIVCVVVLC